MGAVDKSWVVVLLQGAALCLGQREDTLSWRDLYSFNNFLQFQGTENSGEVTTIC